MILARVGFYLLFITGVLPIRAMSAQNGDVFEQISQLFTKIAHDATPSIVKIAAIRPMDKSFDLPKKRIAYGSGCLISSDGYVLTCCHVVENALSISVFFQNQEISAKLIQLSPEIDIALLKIDGMNLPSLTLGNSDTTNIGEWVVSIGYPFSLNPFVARGIIGAKDEFGRSFFLDILTCPGNSGGPLLNLKGEVIGISSALFQFDQEVSGTAVAIPINQIKNCLSLYQFE